jgi:phage tail-like protein
MPITQKNSLSSVATDPLRNFKFQVSISGLTSQFGFMNVQGLNVQIDVIAYREGGFNTTTQKMPGQADFSPIVMSRGVVYGPQPELAWLQQLFIVMQGQGNQTATNNFRQTVDIQLMDHPVTTKTAPIGAWFRVYNAWPTAVSWSDLDAGANALFINQMSLAHEGFDVNVAVNNATEVGPPPWTFNSGS